MKKKFQIPNSKFQKIFWAAAPSPLGTIGKGEGFGRFSFDKIISLPVTLADFLSLIVGFLTIAAGLWFMIKFIIGAFSWISAGGNPESLKNARQTMINALIGILLVVGAIGIVSIIGTVLGLDILNIGELFKNIMGPRRGLPEEPRIPRGLIE